METAEEKRLENLIPAVEPPTPDTDPQETREWVEAFDQILDAGPDRARFILNTLVRKAQLDHLRLPELVQTPYINTIPTSEEPPYPGDESIERRLRAIIRWNAAVMVHRANLHEPGIGGHLATYASAASLYEVGFNHFFRGRENGDGDLIFFQGHSSPGIYARSFLEGRFTTEQLESFRRECGGKGLSSYPHPWLMPHYWEFPTVSMGLGPLTAIYQARFLRYLRDRGIKDTSNQRVWAFMGDGESDEPESLGALSLAAREGLDNLTFVVNCNLQRLDGPVRGNGKVIQELEAVFRGSGWNVIKVVWGRDWDPLLAADPTGLLVKRMGEAVDGEYQKYSVESGAYTREHFFGKYPELQKLVEHLSDDEIRYLRRGGHDVAKVYAAYDRAVNHANGRPTAILAKTVKGWTLGEGAEGRNATHQWKKFTDIQLRKFRDLLQLPISDKQLSESAYYMPPKDSEEMVYLQECRRKLGGHVPKRVVRVPKEEIPGLDRFQDLLQGSTVVASTTKAFGRVLWLLLRDAKIGKRVVPIMPDEARTFGLEGLFKEFGIYSSVGQKYEPVDSDMILSYREAKDGQMIEEGITEAGSLATWTSSGTSYASQGVTTIPFYIFYSMFGFQRVGDAVWAAADARSKGFLMGATAGRTTLNGEGLQHEDGQSPILFSVVPTVRAYDPAFAYELAVIIHDGLKRMYQDQENCFYYITIYNENYPMPKMPDGSAEGIVRGLYLLQKSANASKRRVQLLGSGTILREALRAQTILAEKFEIAADVWSATSYQSLRRDGLEADRWNLYHPDEDPRVPYVLQQLGGTAGPIVAATDFMRAVPEQVAKWLPDRITTLGTDGFGRSDTRAALRRHFEVDAESIAYAALYRLAKRNEFPAKQLAKAMKDLGLDPTKRDPWSV